MKDTFYPNIYIMENNRLGCIICDKNGCKNIQKIFNIQNIILKIMKDLKSTGEVKQYKNYNPLPMCQIVISNFNVVIYTYCKQNRLNYLI